MISMNPTLLALLLSLPLMAALLARDGARLRESLGEYPHKGMNVTHKPQATRLVKVACQTVQEDGTRGCDPSGEGKDVYNLNMTAKWLEAAGTPYCPCCNKRMQVVARKTRKPKVSAPHGA